MNDTHTKLPWVLDGKLIRPNDDDTRKAPVANFAMSHGLGEAGERDKANAEFAWKAVNQHQQLVDAVKKLAEALRAEHKQLQYAMSLCHIDHEPTCATCMGRAALSDPVVKKIVGE